ncbi:MAG TPA: cytidylate kinase-like family protein [Bacteroidales bacterium]|mgnify:CR=1 FL=1|nr:cytidylate kinase-like family protein [Bacteroidales bacterium]HPT01272.1 cytidylate kinase-like family protein [Bacteroidales bacterium]
MPDLLSEYMMRRLGEIREVTGKPQELGPVITFSRETGCNASGVAHDLAIRLNEHAKEHNLRGGWQFINREILEKSAEKLHMEDTSHIKKVLTDKERNMMDEVVEALSGKRHMSDLKIKKTTQDVLKEFAERGNIILVGRGGVIACRHITRSMHIRIEAPLEWRINEIMNRFGYDRKYAREFVLKSDKERERVIECVTGGKTSNTLFDIIVNGSRFTIGQITEMVFQLALAKEII